MKEGKILIADDNRGILDALQILLQKDFEVIKGITGTGQLITELGRGNYDLVLLDMNFKAGVNTGNEGIHWLREIKSRYADVEVVMITAYGDVELAVRALKEGAADFVLKPWENEKLVATLKAVYKLRKSNVEISGLKTREEMLKTEANRAKPFVAGASSSMREIQQTMAKVADTDANVLITGENGTGKEMIAREIHRLSSRASELFVLVDLSAVAETLFESELFGHRKGAFTDAIEDKTGRILMAQHGTLFLDEIGNIPMHLQSKLLNVLQTRTIVPVGASSEIGVDIRLIATTPRGICWAAFAAGTGEKEVAELERRWASATIRENPGSTRSVADRIFAYDQRREPISLHVEGTNFQVRVWEALLKIPYGQVASYADLAGTIGNQGATRAVGTAIAQNPVAYIIPCHRVIRSEGIIGNYHWNPGRKGAMIGLERGNSEKQTVKN